MIELTGYVVVMDRDRRLTGFLRGQSDAPLAPAGFEVNNPWRVCLSDRERIQNTHILSRSRSVSHRWKNIEKKKGMHLIIDNLLYESYKNTVLLILKPFIMTISINQLFNRGIIPMLFL